MSTSGRKAHAQRCTHAPSTVTSQLVCAPEGVWAAQEQNLKSGGGCRGRSGESVSDGGTCFPTRATVGSGAQARRRPCALGTPAHLGHPRPHPQLLLPQVGWRPSVWAGQGQSCQHSRVGEGLADLGQSQELQSHNWTCLAYAPLLGAPTRSLQPARDLPEVSSCPQPAALILGLRGLGTHRARLWGATSHRPPAPGLHSDCFGKLCYWVAAQG